MNKKRKYIISTLSILILIASISLVCLYKASLSNKINSLATYEEEAYPDNYAFYVDGVLQPTNVWPKRSLYQYNQTASSCTNDVEMIYDGIMNRVDIDAKASTTCNLHFNSYSSQGKTTFSQYIKSLADTTANQTDWQVNYLQDAYRFRGGNDTVDIPNYVCIGTSDAETCLADPNIYLYRVILAENVDYTNTQDNESQGNDLAVKVIATEYEAAYSRQGTTWDSSNAFRKKLLSEKGTTGYYNQRLKDTGAYGNDIILRAKYYAGYSSTNPTTGTNSLKYVNEANIHDVYDLVMLMYPSDYLFSTVRNNDFTENYCYSNSAYYNGCNSWIKGTEDEHFLIKYNTTNYYTIKLDVSANRVITATSSTTTAAGYYKVGYRPVFYLQPDTILTGGDGSISNPYMVSYESDSYYESLAKTHLYKNTLTEEKAYIPWDVSSQSYLTTACMDNNATTGSCLAAYRKFVLGVYKNKYLDSNNEIKEKYLLKVVDNHVIENDVPYYNYLDEDYHDEINQYYNSKNIRDNRIVKAYWNVGTTDSYNLTNYINMPLKKISYYEQKETSKCGESYFGQFGVPYASDVLSIENNLETNMTRLKDKTISNVNDDGGAFSSNMAYGWLMLKDDNCHNYILTDYYDVDYIPGPMPVYKGQTNQYYNSGYIFLTSYIDSPFVTGYGIMANPLRFAVVS